MRKAEFKDEAKFKPTTIKDSRFGLRKIYLNPNEVPSIGLYSEPGRGPNGEHQS